MTIYLLEIERRFNMLTIQNYIPVTKAKSAFLDIIRKIEGSDDAIAITKNGVPEAVLLSMSKFEGLMETMEILSDEKAMKSIRKSIKEARDQKWLDYDEVFGE
jgi:prevent-host-death family protein